MSTAPGDGGTTAWQRPAWLTAIRGAERALTGTALVLAMIGLAVMAGLTCYQVFMRFVMGHPSTWSEVLARSVMIWSVYLAAAAAFREGAVIAAEVVMRSVPVWIGRAMQIFAGGAALGFLAILVVTGIDMFRRTASQQLAGLEISISWIYLALPVGGVLAAFAVLVRTSELLEPGATLHASDTEPVA